MRRGDVTDAAPCCPQSYHHHRVSRHSGPPYSSTTTQSIPLCSLPSSPRLSDVTLTHSLISSLLTRSSPLAISHATLTSEAPVFKSQAVATSCHMSHYVSLVSVSSSLSLPLASSPVMTSVTEPLVSRECSVPMTQHLMSSRVPSTGVTQSPVSTQVVESPLCVTSLPFTSQLSYVADHSVDPSG